MFKELVIRKYKYRYSFGMHYYIAFVKTYVGLLEKMWHRFLFCM
jgi:hypothetical protein